MPVYLVTYDLRKEGQNYGGLYKAIKDLGNDAFSIMQSTLLVYDPAHKADVIFNYFGQFLDENDQIIVTELDVDNYKAWLSSTALAWLKDTLGLPCWL